MFSSQWLSVSSQALSDYGRTAEANDCKFDGSGTGF